MELIPALQKSVIFPFDYKKTNLEACMNLQIMNDQINLKMYLLHYIYCSTHFPEPSWVTKEQVSVQDSPELPKIHLTSEFELNIAFTVSKVGKVVGISSEEEANESLESNFFLVLLLLLMMLVVWT
jgi:hypothetical protein